MVPAGCLMLLSFTADQGMIIVCLYIIVIIEAGMHCAIMANPLDIAPAHVGIVTAFVCIFFNLGSAFSPLVAGFIADPEVKVVNLFLTIPGIHNIFTY